MTGKRGPISGDKRSKAAGAMRGNPGEGKRLPAMPFHADNLPAQIPPYPDLKLQKTKNIWDSFWRSTVARAIDWDSDQVALTRWAQLTDRWFRIMNQLEKEGPTIPGSKGTEVLNPLSQEQARIATQIKDLEAQLGLTPMARARLGLTAAEGQLLAAQLNEMVRQEDSTTNVVELMSDWD